MYASATSSISTDILNDWNSGNIPLPNKSYFAIKFNVAETENSQPAWNVRSPLTPDWSLLPLTS